METGTIFNIKHYSINDGPGIRTTVFFKGCPLACQWCHNPESQRSAPQLMVHRQRCTGCGACREICPHGCDWDKCTACGRCTQVCNAQAREIVGEEMTVTQVVDRVERDLVFYDQSGGGVTFSGGEPLHQPEFLRSLLAACREREIHTAVDTSGYATPETVRAVAPLTDLFLYDLKLMDRKKHREYTGVGNELILENLALLAAEHPRVAVRIPLVPGITDRGENLRAIARFLRGLPLAYIELLPYHASGSDKYRRLGREYQLNHLVQPGRRQLQEAANSLAAAGHITKIGGMNGE